MMRAPRLRTLVLLTALWLPAAAPPAAAVGSAHVEAELVAETAWVQPGRPFWTGLYLRMAPEWHTYWKNPGDAGLPTRLAWRLPDGFSAGPIEWPYPERFGEPPVVSYGYSGEVLLLVEITPPPSLPGGEVTLAARADWLECKDVCLPGRAEVAVTLPVRSDPPSPSPAWSPTFRRARSRLPERGTGVAARLLDQGGALRLTLGVPREWGTVRDAYFFPDAKATLDHAAPQALSRVGSEYRLDLPPSEAAARPVTELVGVLVAHPETGEARAVHLAARASKARSRKPASGSRPQAKEDEP